MRRFAALATTVADLPELGAFIIVLAEDETGAGARLEVQLAHAFDEQDRRLGQDTYCLCVETGATHYGGVTSWSLSMGTLVISLDRSAAEELGVNGGFAIDVPPSKSHELMEALTRAVGPHTAKPSL